MKPDRAWCEAVVAHLQPVFDEDGSDWSFHGIADPPEALLWEASPTAFVARHPDAGIEEDGRALAAMLRAHLRLDA